MTEKNVGQEIVSRLGKFAEKLKTVESASELSKVVTVRKVKLNLHPRVFTASEIKEIRSALMVSQAVLAQYLGVPLATYQDWEQGRSTASGPACRLLGEMRSDATCWANKIRELGQVTTA